MATSLAQVNLADTEAKQQKGMDALDKIQIPTDINPEEKPKEVYNVLFKLIKKKKGRFYLDNCCDNVLNKKTGVPERIWLLNGARSIWDSDLEYLLKDKSRYERSRRGMDIVFIDGVCRVRSEDTLRLEFLRNHTKNVGKRRSGSVPGDFYEYDPQQEQRDRHEKQMIKIEMMFTARDMPMEKARPLAAYLGVVFTDELGMPKSDEGIKTELVMKADNDPVTFQKYLNSREVEVSWMVRKGLVDGKIDTGDGNGTITWANGKGFIAKLPSLRKPLEYLTELALTNSEEGRGFLDKLKQIVT